MTESKDIIVDGIKFSISSGVPFSFDGVFSQQKRSGFELSFTTYGSQQGEEVDNLLKKEKVTVEDPFAGRTYDASTWMKSNSFQVGKEEKRYVIEVKEIDVLPPFDRVEIDEMTFQVLKYDESITSDDKIGRHALLKLSKEEFDQLHKLFERPFIKFRRIGIDEVPLELQFGGATYWSQHTDEGKEYFKQIVRLFPLDAEFSKLNLASGVIQNTMMHMLISLHVRFEFLVKELTKNKAISEETQSVLLDPRLRDLLPSEKIDQLYNNLEKVEEADKYL